MQDGEIRALMALDLSRGSEVFRESLLARCLSIVGGDEAHALGDDELDMLAAAGDMGAFRAEARQ